MIETLSYQRKIPAYIYMFSRVSQLTVLKNVDLFVTHGGLGSVKESIRFGVPMLVYPLDLHYDQNGNGLKVEYHGLGLRGVFQSERSMEMRRKMKEILDDRKFKERVVDFRNRIESTTCKDIEEPLKHLYKILSEQTI